MQERMLDGSYGEPRPLEYNVMERLLDDPEVDHVEVFNGTDAEMERRNRLFRSSHESKARKKRKSKSKLQKKSRKNNR